MQTILLELLTVFKAILTLFVTQRVVRHWDSLSRGAVDVPPIHGTRPGWMEPWVA